MHFFLIAGEPSGDALGAALMAGLKSAMHTSEFALRFSGIGGPMMAKEGLESLFEYDELAIMGLVEVIPRIVAIRRRMIETVNAIESDLPDALITIDAPGFTVGVVKRLKSHACPRIHYVAPTVWAWRPRRVHKFRRHFDHLMTLLPFEPPYFEAVGLSCGFVGHPVLQSGADQGDGEGFRTRHKIPEGAQLVCVLPGSRRGEVRRMLEPFGAALAIMMRDRPELRAVIPAMPNVEKFIRDNTAAWAVPVEIVSALDERFDAMAASNVALAASGTVSLELAMAKVAAVISYRMAPVTVWLLKRMLKVDYANLVNIILGRGAVPELIQENATPEKLAAEIARILGDEIRASEIVEAQNTAIMALAPPVGHAGDVKPLRPGDCAAIAVRNIVDAWSPAANA